MRCWTRLLWFVVVVAGCGAASDEPVVDTDTDSDADPADVPFPIDELALTGLVDPMIGTEGPGNVIPGALVPHGMVRLSPDTNSRAGSIDSYDWSDSAIEGFTHLNLEGPGGSANGYSQILVLPQTGALEVDRVLRAAPFTHDHESARPGLYTVTLDSGVKAELTATGHAAVHRYTFPAGPARVLLDVGHSNGASVDGMLTIDGANVDGWGHYNVHPIASMVTNNDGRTAHAMVYVHAEASVPPTETGTFRGRTDTLATPGATEVTGAWTGAWIGWDFATETTVELAVGISLIDGDQAVANLRAEVGDASFDDVAARADAAWNTVLNRVQVQGDTSSQRMFYTALYHTMFQPADYTEAGGRYQTGFSGEHHVRQAEGFHYVTDDWCMWDTYRTSHPLRALTEPEWPDDIIRSMLVAYEEGGWLPKCTWHATGYSRVMIGNHAVPIIADAFVKGLRRFDHDLAWEAVDHAGMEDVPLLDGLCGYFNLGTPPDYLTLGYVPTECDPGQSASMTLEHAYDDWAAGVLADGMGRTEDAARYAARGQNWHNTWDPSVGFARGRDRQGNWREPFDPTVWNDFNDFVEATSWIYSFHVQQDVPGLIEAMGGDAAFVARLDTFFDDGQYDPSNQPSYHIPWLYAFAGEPWRTQARVREVVERYFDDGPDGLPGNDDAGSTSAWLVWAMLGMYPVAPGDPTYTLAAPLFSRIDLHLHPGFYDGGVFTIQTVGDPATEPYVQGMTLDGEPLDTPFLTHARIAAGGTLVVTLGAEPSTWGGRPAR